MALELVSSFPKRLKEALELNNITASEFAKKLSYSKQAISAYLNGTRSPKRPVIVMIATALDINEAWLCGYNVPMERVYNKVQAEPQKPNQVIAIARGGDKVQYDLTEAEMQAIIALLDTMKKDK